jgi:hypothetical protein
MVTPSKENRGLRKGIDADDGRRRREASTVQLRKDKKEDGLQKRRRNAGGDAEMQMQTSQTDVASRAPDVPDPGLAETLKSLPEDVSLLQSPARGKQVHRPFAKSAPWLRVKGLWNGRIPWGGARMLLLPGWQCAREAPQRVAATAPPQHMSGAAALPRIRAILSLAASEGRGATGHLLPLPSVAPWIPLPPRPQLMR